MIKELNVSGFTCFENNKFTFSPNINIFIGKNGTGKTHILKLISAILSANKLIHDSKASSKERFENIIAEQLIAYFKPEQLGRLVRRQQGRNNSKVSLNMKGKEFSFGFSTTSKTAVKIEKNEDIEPIDFLYIPPREMFSLFEGFLSLNENREVSFDETYIQLAKALGAPLLKGKRFDEANELLKPLEEELQASAIKENGRFYLKDSTGKMEAHLVAEGIRKIASIMYLIGNGELRKNSTLFWDEPEANLNPKLISIIVKFLLKLSENRIQIFISTHDYLLTHQLSLTAEYKELNPEAPKLKFFCIAKEENKISIEEGNTLAEINNNPILDEFASYYDKEQEFFNKTIESHDN